MEANVNVVPTGRRGGWSASKDPCSSECRGRQLAHTSANSSTTQGSQPAVNWEGDLQDANVYVQRRAATFLKMLDQVETLPEAVVLPMSVMRIGESSQLSQYGR